MSEHEGTLPHSTDAEEAVLGCLINNRAPIAQVLDVLEPKDFYHDRYGEIYGAILHMHEERMPVDLVTLTDCLKINGILDMVGGRMTVVNLSVDDAFTGQNLRYHAEIIKRQSLRRQLYKGIVKVAKETRAEEEFDPSIASATNLVTELNKLNTKQTAASMEQLAMKVLAEIETRNAKGDEIQGLATGFLDFDEVMAGFHPGELTIIAARPSMGKTQLSLNMAYQVASGFRIKDGVQNEVAFFSLEMSKEQLVERMYSLTSGLEGQMLRHGRVRDEEWGPLQTSCGTIGQLPLTIYDATDGIRTVRQLEAKIHRLEMEGRKPKLIIVDHLSYLHDDKLQSAGRTLEIEAIVEALHNMAIALKIPVVLLSQLSREVEKRQNKRPMLSDLRDSGASEQTADNVIFLFREDYYNKQSTHKGDVEIIVAKQRNGPTETVFLKLQITTGKFFDCPLEDRPVYESESPENTKRYRKGKHGYGYSPKED